MDLTRAPQTDPVNVYRYRDSLYAADLMAAAVAHLDFFTWLAGRPSTLAEIQAHFGFAERPTDVMLTLFAANGFVRQRGGVFEATEVAREHLVQGSPWFMGPYYASLKDRPIALDYLKVLRSGKPANWGSFEDEQAWAQAMETDEFARNFTAAMDCRGVYLGRAVARALNPGAHRRLLDIGGGSGIYACCVAAVHPQLAAAVLEKPPVDGIARRAIAERGFTERVAVVAGDMFRDELPAGFDMHLWSNVFHDWEVPQVRELLGKSARALPAGGLIVIHDMHLNADRTGPLAAAEYSALLMHSTEGRVFSIAEQQAWLTELGFHDLQFTPGAANRSILTARKA